MFDPSVQRNRLGWDPGYSSSNGRSQSTSNPQQSFGKWNTASTTQPYGFMRPETQAIKNRLQNMGFQNQFVSRVSPHLPQMSSQSSLMLMLLMLMLRSLVSPAQQKTTPTPAPTPSTAPVSDMSSKT